MKEDVYNPDIDSQLGSPQFDRNLMGSNPVAPEAIMEKLALQQEAEKQYAAKKMENLIHGMNEKKISAMDTEPIQDSSSKELKVARTVNYPQIKPAEDLVDFQKEEVEQTPFLPSKSSSIKQRIQDAEARLGIDHSFSAVKSRSEQARSFFDEFGEETFYVKNISNGIVVISDLDRGQNGISGENRISRGAVIDLLSQYDLETLKKSRELRTAISGRGSQLLLKRLTPEEYLEEIEREAQNKEKIEQFKVMAELKASTGQSKPKKPIRPVIESKLLQLQLSYSDTPHKGITPVEFIQWLNTEKLTLDELDYILSGVDDKDIRMFVHAKKQDLL